LPHDVLSRILDTYALGHYDEAVARLSSVQNFDDLSGALHSQTAEWIAAHQPDEGDRYLHVGALVVLEAARVGFSDRRFDREEREQARRLIEWGADLLRRRPPADFEHRWLLASVALVQGELNAQGEEAGRGARPGDRQLWLLRYNTYLRQAMMRFPSEPRFLLAVILARPEVRRTVNRPGTSACALTHGITDGCHRDESEPRRLVRQAIADLTPIIAAFPSVALEVRLHRGILLFQRGDFLDSLADFEASATERSDSQIAYMGYLYAGLTLENLNRQVEATEAYRSALRIVPQARSATLALAAVLFQSDRRDEAAALLQTTFETPEPADPWQEFSAGDYRFWVDDLAALREPVRP
jgi:tetratricopeptide (TPR) repeat protein